MSVCVIDYINVEYIGNFKEEKEFNQSLGENENYKCLEDLEYIERIKAYKNVEEIMNSFSPSDINEIYSISGNAKSVSKINWSARDLFNALYKSRSSIFIPLGRFEKMVNGIYNIGDEYIHSNSSLYSHENGHFGLFVNLEMNQIKYEYAYCENYGGVSLDGENCDFCTLENPYGEDPFESHLFNALRKIYDLT